jgi:hypothetical protein
MWTCTENSPEGIMTDDSNAYHTTEHELEYIRNIGRWSPYAHYDRLQLLLGYQRAAFARYDWGHIHRGRVLEFLAEEIARESESMRHERVLGGDREWDND